MDEFNQQQDTVVGSALNQLPIAPLPPDFTARVMAGVHAVQSEDPLSTPVRFRLQFLDIALALFWSLILTFIGVLTLWWSGLIQPVWLPQAPSGLSLVDHLPLPGTSLFYAAIFLLLLEMGILGLIGLNVLGERPSTY